MTIPKPTTAIIVSSTVQVFNVCLIKQTLKTWTVLETIIAVVGLGMVMLMSIWVH